MKQLFFILICSPLLLLTSCENDQSVSYKFTGLKAANVNTSAGLPQVDNSDSIRKEIYGIRLYLYPVEVSRTGRSFDPSESGVMPVDPIADIDITSDVPLDSAYPAGSELTSCFYYLPGTYFHIVPLSDGSAFEPTAKYNSDYAEHNFPEYADLLLARVPANFAFRKFYIKLKYRSGYYRTDSTNLVKLY
ncbi:MAG: hypothetical protein ACJ77K_16535 [Bacteroidia bacterium]